MRVRILSEVFASCFIEVILKFHYSKMAKELEVSIFTQLNDSFKGLIFSLYYKKGLFLVRNVSYNLLIQRSVFTTKHNAVTQCNDLIMVCYL